SAAACPNPPRTTLPRAGRGGGCGTSYAAALVTGVAAAMVSINPELTPKQIKRLLRQSALPMSAGTATRIEPTRPIKAGRRSESGVSAVGQFARLDMLQALKLAIESHPGESSE
ncbi:MAG TPA: hypothetical protein DGQ94_21165, partial [Pseudomonas sp.]|nr:hypothetical protein [Pseudomonas sp.]